MNKIEALRAELKCREMVEGTGLDWWKVVKTHYGYNRSPICSSPIKFERDQEDYEFALGIIEGKPVWEGDEAYWTDLRGNTHKLTVVAGCDLTIPGWSWNPPKPKTIMVELLVEDAEFLMHPAFPIINQQRVSKARRKALEELK